MNPPNEANKKKDKKPTWAEIIAEFEHAYRTTKNPDVKRRAKWILELARDIREGEKTEAAMRIKRDLDRRRKAKERSK